MTRVDTQRGGCGPNTSLTAALSVSPAILAKSTSSGPAGAQPKNAGDCPPKMISRACPVRSASRAAQRSACSEPTDPSTPTTIRPGPELAVSLICSPVGPPVPTLPAAPSARPQPAGPVGRVAAQARGQPGADHHRGDQRAAAG